MKMWLREVVGLGIFWILPWLAAGETVTPLMDALDAYDEADTGLELHQQHARLHRKSPFSNALDSSAHCCQCSSGQVTWSRDGCKVCQDEVQKIALVSENCKVESRNFQGQKACQSECDSKFPQVGIFVEEKEDEVAKKSGTKKWGSSTTEKCCKCKSGKIGWSASGRCSFCKGQVSKTASVSEECKKTSPKFIGNSQCAKACKSKVSGWSWIEKNAKSKALAVKSAKWGSSTTEKCCKCKSGKIGWSASGRCSFCKGQVSKTKSVSEECRTKSPKFMGNTKCVSVCKSKMQSSVWSWTQQHAKENQFLHLDRNLL
eukprot:symbB.v1.2.002031.t1/scaffold104.1/size473687/9